MDNTKKALMVIAALVVIGGGSWAYSMRDQKTTNNQTTPAAQQSSAETAKSDAQKFLEEYKGEDFDRIFIANMIEHHNGAVEMANLALQNAKHDELKGMAREIVSAQTTEINQMKSWQQAWGYPSTSSENMVDHSAMGMMGDMDAMSKSLEGKTGDEFDKAFLTSMIEHHDSAIAMSRPAATNASHQEIKDLAKAIIEAQEGEISQMRDWLKEWGYES